MKTTDAILTLSSIEVHTNLQKVGSPVIKLGYMAELVTPKYRGLVLYALKSLSDEDLDLLDNINKKILREPYDYLSEFFDEAWEKTEPGNALGYLAEKFKFSIRFNSPERIEDLPEGIDDFTDKEGRDLLLKILDKESAGLHKCSQVYQLDIAA